ncbi:MAG: DUF1552 domain-containing protein [Pirellulales bacterium]
MTRSLMHRRKFLRGTGIALGLPLLGAMIPSTLSRGRAAEAGPDVRRLLAICAPLGIHTPNLFPTKAGKDYEVTPYLEPLQPLRDKFSVISGLTHPDVDGGHAAEASFLTGAAHPGAPSFRNTISLDQYAAERIGHLTRYPSIALSASYTGISVSRSGVRLPAEGKPSKLFASLFLEGTAEQKRNQMNRIVDGRSVMDFVREQAKDVVRDAGSEDRRTLDQYFGSVREVEQRLAAAEQWAKLPKPKVDRKPPSDIEDRSDFTGRMSVLYDLIFLAIQTDSTRLITLIGAGGNEVVSLDGVDDGWHNLSHHGKDPQKLKQLAIIEKEEMRLFAELTRKLSEVHEGERTLLDQTAILLGSNMGNASSHSNANLPIVAAGGRFKHTGHIAFEPAAAPPLCDLYVSFLRHLGLPDEKFSSGSATLKGFEST